MAPKLNWDDLTQTAALPLGSWLKTDPWDDTEHMLNARRYAPMNARDKMPFEITPIFYKLQRYEVAAAPPPAPADNGAQPANGAAAPADNGAQQPVVNGNAAPADNNAAQPPAANGAAPAGNAQQPAAGAAPAAAPQQVTGTSNPPPQ
jgi:hypothetical protein